MEHPLYGPDCTIIFCPERNGGHAYLCNVIMACTKNYYFPATKGDRPIKALLLIFLTGSKDYGLHKTERNTYEMAYNARNHLSMGQPSFMENWILYLT